MSWKGSLQMTNELIDRAVMWSPGARAEEGATLDASSGDIFLGRDVVIEEGALVRGPAVIGDGCVVRHGAYLRGDVVLGAGCVVGGEMKNVLALDKCELPHYGYVGDSLLGYNAHFGCGALTGARCGNSCFDGGDHS